jgi:hypothetical protein
MINSVKIEYKELNSKVSREVPPIGFIEKAAHNPNVPKTQSPR